MLTVITGYIARCYTESAGPLYSLDRGQWFWWYLGTVLNIEKTLCSSVDDVKIVWSRVTI